MDNFCINGETVEALDPTTGKWGLAKVTSIIGENVEVWFDGYNAKNGKVILRIPSDDQKNPIRKQTPPEAEPAASSSRRIKQRVYLLFDLTKHLFGDWVSFANYLFSSSLQRL